MVPALAAGPPGLCFVCYRLQLPPCRAKVSFDASHYLHCFHCKYQLYHDAALHCSDSDVELYDVDQQQSPLSCSYSRVKGGQKSRPMCGHSLNARFENTRYYCFTEVTARRRIA